MFSKILFFIYFVNVSRAVFVKSSDTKDSHTTESSKTYQVINLYPSSSHIVHKFDSYAYPKYEFEYTVSDKKTGDHKHHHEERDGDRVRGEYSLVEPDGSMRKVQYDADDYKGFNAVVSKGMQKHGEHAFSIFGHTRQFFPIGHNVKINSYFPGKDYHHEHLKNLENETEEKSTKPVEEIDQGLSKKDLSKSVENEFNHNITAETVEPNHNEDLIKMDPNESALIQVPTVVSMIMHEESSDGPIMPTVEKTEIKDEQIPQKDEMTSDSDVASSFYHSRMYYVNY